MIKNWSSYLYLMTISFIIAMSVLMLYTIKIESMSIPLLDKYMESKEISLLDALLISSDLGGYKKWLILGGALIVAIIIDKLFVIPFFYFNLTKAGKVEKFETIEKFEIMKAKQIEKKANKKIKQIEKEGKKYE